MVGYVIEKHGFITAALLIADAVSEMIDNGFTQIFPVAPFDPSSAGDTFSVTLEASGDVDPLNAAAVTTKQPWRVKFDVISKNLVGVYVATPTQLLADGTHAFETSSAGANTDIVGATGGIATGGVITPANLPAGFINRTTRVSDDTSYPLSYILSITPRGFYLGTWEEAITMESSTYFNWVLVQRPVDRDTGTVLTTGKAPVWCVNQTNDNLYQFVVRESDIFRPGKRRSASVNEEDSEAILNKMTQVRLTEDGKYVINFPSRLNTSRYRYPHELDMIGSTSADVVSQWSNIDIEVYGEEDPRTYKALQANAVGNTGMRILVLTVGGGI